MVNNNNTHNVLEDDDVEAGVSVAEEEMCTSEYINHGKRIIQT